MTKIPTIFVRDERRPGHPVTDVVKPECAWVFQGEGAATIKMDGTNVKISNGQLYKRQKPKDRDYDEASYIACARSNPSDRWAWEAFDRGHDGDGIYELVGPHVQDNPQQHAAHTLVRVVPPSACVLQLDAEPPRSFAGLREYLRARPIEGLVFHHRDGRMAKIKRRDFGLKWPA